MSKEYPRGYAALSHDLIAPESQIAQRMASSRTRIAAGCVLILIVMLLSINPAVFRGAGFDGFENFWRYHIDFDVYREGGAAFLAGENLYTQDYSVGGITLPFTYPPLAAICFAPFTWLPVNIGATLLNWASVAMLWWIVVLFLRTMLPSWSRASIFGSALVLTAAGVLMEPVRQTISFGQVNILLAGLVTIDLLARRTWLPRGFLVGFAAALKLTPAVFGLYFLIRRDWKAAGVSVASGVGWSLVAWIFTAESSREYWLHTLHDPSRIGGLAYAANQSFRGTLVRIVGDDSAKIWWLLFVAVIIALISFVMHGFAQRQHFAVAALFNSLIALLCSPVSWSHHWVWAVPMTFVLGCYAYAATRISTKVWLWVATSYTAFFFFVGMHWLFPHSDNQEIYWSNAQQLLGASYVFGSIIAVGCATWYFATHRASTPTQATPSSRR